MAYELVSRPGGRSMMMLTRPGRAAPSDIEAIARLDDLGLTVSFSIRVDPGGTPRILHLAVDVAGGSAVTSRALRSVRLDELAREAIRQLEQPATMVEDEVGMPGAFRVEGDAPGVAWVGPAPGRRRTPRERVAEAARIYNAAAAKGSRAPTLAVATELEYSRSQASRLIRAARDIGLIEDPDAKLPFPGATSPYATVVEPDRPDPGPLIFRDPTEPWPGQRES